MQLADYADINIWFHTKLALFASILCIKSGGVYWKGHVAKHNYVR